MGMLIASTVLVQVPAARAQRWRERFQALIRFELTANAWMPIRPVEDAPLQGYWIPDRLIDGLGDWSQNQELRILERGEADGTHSIFFPVHAHDLQTQREVSDWLIANGVLPTKMAHPVLRNFQSASRSLFVPTSQVAAGIKISDLSVDPNKNLSRQEVEAAIAVSRYLTALKDSNRLSVGFIPEDVGYALRGLNRHAASLRNYTPILRRGLLVPGFAELHPNGPIQTEPIVRDFLSYPHAAENPRRPRRDHARLLGSEVGLEMADFIAETGLIPHSAHGQNLLAFYRHEADGQVRRSLYIRDLPDMAAIAPLFARNFRRFPEYTWFISGGSSSVASLRHRPSMYRSLTALANMYSSPVERRTEVSAMTEFLRLSALAYVEAMESRFFEKTDVELRVERFANPVASIPMDSYSLAPWLRREQATCVVEQISGLGRVD